MNTTQLIALRQIAETPRYRIRGGHAVGSPKRFSVERYAPEPGKFSWVQVAGPFGTYAAAVEAFAVLSTPGRQ